MIERRKEQRVISTFKSAYVKCASGIHYVTLRNLSPSGICFDSYPGVEVGDEIEFCLNCGQVQRGTVKWVANGRFGVIAETSTVIGFEYDNLRPRSVRLPLIAKAELFTNGEYAQVNIYNLSLRGTCIDAVCGLSVGHLVSIRIGGRSFELATVRWQTSDKAGICFAKPVAPREFSELIRNLQKEQEHMLLTGPVQSLPRRGRPAGMS
jgi:hypothetical protein